MNTLNGYIAEYCDAYGCDPVTMATGRDNWRRRAETAEQALHETAIWKPIETAPKDGTRLWLYFPHRNSEDDSQIVGWWEDDLTGGYWTTHCDSNIDDPTHWMPCPASPPPSPDTEGTRTAPSKPVEE